MAACNQNCAMCSVGCPFMGGRAIRQKTDNAPSPQVKVFPSRKKTTAYEAMSQTIRIMRLMVDNPDDAEVYGLMLLDLREKLIEEAE